MAVTLNTAVERILDSVLRRINADTLRLAESPPNAQVAGHLATALVGAETEVAVTNGHLWPKIGRVSIGGPNPETLDYVANRTLRGNGPPTYNGIGNPPNGRLILRPGVTVANAHLLNVPVFIPPDNAGLAARAMDSGMIGTHDLAGLLKALRENITPAVLTCSGDGAVDGSTVVDAGAFVASAHIGDTVTIVTTVDTNAPQGETRTIIANDANSLTVSPAFSARVNQNDTYQVNVVNFDRFIETLYDELPANFDSNNNRVEGDTAESPEVLATTVVNALIHVTTQYGGVVPTFGFGDDTLLARNVVPFTRLTAPAGALDTEITVADASKLIGVTGIVIGATSANIDRNFARRGGQGPNRIRLTAALGGGGEAIGAVVSPVGISAERGLSLKAPAPHAFGRLLETYLLAAVAAIEAYTVPT